MSYANTPFEKGYLARHKRASVLSPVTLPVNILRLLGNGIISTIVSAIVDSTQFIVGALTGQACPKVEKLSLCGLITAAVLQPIQAFKTVTCYAIQQIGTQGQILLAKTLDLSIQFFKKVFLPGLHTTLNVLDKYLPLPPQIKAMIIVFNMVYKFLEITGYLN